MLVYIGATRILRKSFERSRTKVLLPSVQLKSTDVSEEEGVLLLPNSSQGGEESDAADDGEQTEESSKLLPHETSTSSHITNQDSS